MSVFVILVIKQGKLSLEKASRTLLSSKIQTSKGELKLDLEIKNRYIQVKEETSNGKTAGASIIHKSDVDLECKDIRERNLNKRRNGKMKCTKRRSEYKVEILC